MPRAIHQPIDRVPVRPHAANPVPQLVIAVMPDITALHPKNIIRMMFPHKVSDQIEEALNPAVPVARLHQSSACIVGKALRLVAAQSLREPPCPILLNLRHPPRIVDRAETSATLVVRIKRRLAVELDFLEQAPDRVIPERIRRVVRIGQPDEPPEPVIAIPQALTERIDTRRNPPGRVIRISRHTLQRIRRRQQTPFRVVLNTLDTGRRTNLLQLPVRRVLERSHRPCGILGPAQAARRVIRPLRRLPRAIAIRQQPAARVVAHRLRAALRIDHRDRQALLVVLVLRLVAERILGRNDIPRVVERLRPGVSMRIDRLDELILRVVFHLDDRAVHAPMPHEVAARVVVEELDAAIAMDVLHQLVIAIAIHPLFTAIRVDNPEREALDVVVVARDVAKRVRHAHHPEVRMPGQRDLVAAVVAILAQATRPGVRAVPFEVHAAAGAIGITRQQVMPVAILASIAETIAGRDQIPFAIVFIGSQAPDALALRVVLDNLDDAPLRIEFEGDLHMRHDQPIQTPLGIVVERLLVAGAILDEGDAIAIAMTLVSLEHVMPSRQRQPTLVDTQQRQVLRKIVVRGPDIEQGVIEAAPFGIVIDQLGGMHVEARRVRRDPARAEFAALVVRIEERSIGPHPGDRQGPVDAEVIVVDPLVAERESDRSFRARRRRLDGPIQRAAATTGKLRGGRRAQRLLRPLPPHLLRLRGSLRGNALLLRLRIHLAPAPNAFLRHQDQPADLADLVAVQLLHGLLHGRNLLPKRVGDPHQLRAGIRVERLSRRGGGIHRALGHDRERVMEQHADAA